MEGPILHPQNRNRLPVARFPHCCWLSFFQHHSFHFGRATHTHTLHTWIHSLRKNPYINPHFGPPQASRNAPFPPKSEHLFTGFERRANFPVDAPNPNFSPRKTFQDRKTQNRPPSSSSSSTFSCRTSLPPVFRTEKGTVHKLAGCCTRNPRSEFLIHGQNSKSLRFSSVGRRRRDGFFFFSRCCPEKITLFTQSFPVTRSLSGARRRTDERLTRWLVGWLVPCDVLLF